MRIIAETTSSSWLSSDHGGAKFIQTVVPKAISQYLKNTACKIRYIDPHTSRSDLAVFLSVCVRSHQVHAWEAPLVL